MTIISSAQNQLVKHLSKLGRDAAYRRETNRLLLESQKIILEAQKKHSFLSLCVPQNKEAEFDEAIVLKESISEKISTMKTSDGYFAEIERPENADLSNCKRILVLDQVQNPQNMGSLMRSALAFGFEGIFVMEGSSDPYSPKVIRSSMGACLHIPIANGSYQDFNDLLSKNNISLLIADASGTLSQNENLSLPLALVLGNESSGPNFSQYQNYTKVSVAIEHVDSLNVAIAGTILMHELKGQLWA